MKKICSAVLLTALTLSAGAQTSSDNNVSYSGTNSPYSQFGLGELSEQSSGFSRGMNGLGLAFREHNMVNTLNPASYSSVDSLTFLFDIGVSGSITNFKEGNSKVNANNADFDYMVAAFRAFRHVGVSFGLLPYSNVGYKYSATGYLNPDKSSSYTNTFRGSGGLHQVYLGAGWEILKHFSLGFNGSYMWGNINRVVTNEYNDSPVRTLSKEYSVNVNTYKLDFGAQYTLPIDKKDEVTLGVTYGVGHKLGADPKCEVKSLNPSTSDVVSSVYEISNGLELPSSFAVGLAYNHANKLKLGFDYQSQSWGSVSFPVSKDVNGQQTYVLNDNYFSDLQKFTLGGQYCNNEYGRKFFSRIRYRFGVSYTTPYLKINGQDGPKEFSLSAGFGIPIVNRQNNRSILNLSAQWVKQSAKNMVEASTFRINLGITFNESWFAKWKVE